MNINYIPLCEDLHHNLLSVKKIENHGFIVLFHKNKVDILDYNKKKITIGKLLVIYI